MKICKNCGHENFDINDYCSKCGTRFDDNKMNEQSTQFFPINTTNNKNHKTIGKGKKIAFAIVIMVILIVVICIATNNNSTNNNTLSSSYSSGQKDKEAIGAAMMILEKDLANPSSAKYNSAKVVAKNSDYQYLVYLDVSARNEIGVYSNGKFYVYCKFSSSQSDEFSYKKLLPYVDATKYTLEEAKKLYGI